MITSMDRRKSTLLLYTVLVTDIQTSTSPSQPYQYRPNLVFECTQGLSDPMRLTDSAGTSPEVFIFHGNGVIQNRRAGFGLVLVSRDRIHCERLPALPTHVEPNSSNTWHWLLDTRQLGLPESAPRSFVFTRTMRAQILSYNVGTDSQNITEPAHRFEPNECTDAANSSARQNAIIHSELLARIDSAFRDCQANRPCDYTRLLNTLRTCAQIDPSFMAIYDRDSPEIETSREYSRPRPTRRRSRSAR